MTVGRTAAERLLVPVLRALEPLKPDSLLTLLPPEVSLSRSMSDAAGSITVLNHRIDLHQAHLREGFASFWECSPPARRSFHAALLFMPPSKARARYLACGAAAQVSQGGRMYLAGPKRSGAASMGGMLRECFGPVVDVIRARGCVVLAAERSDVEPVKPAPVIHRHDLFGSELALTSMPGVFSAGRLDPGTKLLLGHLRGVGFERALDWGCGCGVIGAWLALAVPDGMVDLADIDAMAVESAKRTLASNGSRNARAVGSDGFSSLCGKWDLIAANPPFHRSGAADLGPTLQLIRQAPKRLRAGGRLVLVANGHLPYEKPLEDSFGSFRCLYQGGGFKVLEGGTPGQRQLP